MGQRLSGRKVDCDAVWTTGDATLDCISSISWAHREFLRLLPEDFLASFDYHVRGRYLIAECELGSSSAQIVIRSALQGLRHLVLSGVDNVNTFHLLFRGKLVAAFLF